MIYQIPGAAKPKKDALAISPAIRQTRSHAKAMKSLFAAVLVCLLTLAAGCSLFRHSKRSRAPDLPPAVAVETEYRDRWTQKRAGELLASGAAKTDAEAQAMAAAEFARQYPSIGTASGQRRR
jgi:hypothetical protein